MWSLSAKRALVDIELPCPSGRGGRGRMLGAARNNPLARQEVRPSWQREGQDLPRQGWAFKEKPPLFKTDFSEHLGSAKCTLVRAVLSSTAQLCHRPALGRNPPVPSALSLLLGPFLRGRSNPSENMIRRKLFSSTSLGESPVSFHRSPVTSGPTFAQGLLLLLARARVGGCF